MSNPLFDRLFGSHAGSEAVFLRLPSGATVTYAAFLEMAAQFAHVLVDLDIRPGDRIAMQIEKTPQSLAVYAACAQAGVVFLPLNTAYQANEVAYFVQDSGAKLLLCDPAREAEFGFMADGNALQIRSIGSDGAGSFTAQAADKNAVFETVDRSEDDLAAFLYTSGTTGRSKGAMLSQANLLTNAEVLVSQWQFTSADVLLHALPIFHTHGLFVATNVMLLVGGEMIFHPKFDLGQVIAALPDATAMMGVPTFYTRLLGDTRFTGQLAAHMRVFISGSAPLLAETHRQFEERTGKRILERYGMTETNMITSNPFNGERRAGTVGFPLPGVEVKITDAETGTLREAGEIGDIEVRGPNVFQGYWQMPEKTAEDMREDGFFITGDLGRVDEDGYLTIVGRNKDLIISGGFNVYPKEVELVLDDQPGVLESAVIGVPHPDFGEAVVAVLVRDGDPDLEVIKAALKDQLAGFKQPKALLLASELPRNTMGKVQKNVLRDLHRDLFA